MDEDNYINWYQNNFDINAIKFAEKNEEEFNEYCMNLYQELGDEDDYIYEMRRDDKYD